MSSTATHTVTGAFGYSGQYVARILLEKGYEVRTLTNSPDRENLFGGNIAVSPLCFDQPEQLAESLRGTEILYNTYWVRFNHQMFNHASAVENTLRLFEAAQTAGVRRVVHVSITNPSLDSPLEYFNGKARLEKALQQSGLSYGIVRPAVLFGGKDILVNNIAWALRRLPIFGVFGSGAYRLQPMHVQDFAELIVAQGESTEDTVVNAIGPETFTYRELAASIGAIIGKQRPVVSVPPSLGYAVAWALGLLVNDVMLTRDEIQGLMDDLLCVDTPPTGATKLTDWAREHADTLGLRYASELQRRRDRQSAYGGKG